MTRCSYCGGKLEYVTLPRTVYVDPEKKSKDFAVFRMCVNCGRPYKPDVEKAGIPTIDEVRKRGER